MLTTRQRLREHLNRIEAPELRELIAQCITIIGAKQSGAQIPRRAYRDLVAQRIQVHPEVPAPTYLHLDKEQLRERAERASVRREASEREAEPVQLQRLELQNIGPYYGLHSVDLSPSNTHNTVVFVGGNGAGKSTTFQAINWALFSDEYLQDLRELTGRTVVDLVNTRALDDVRVNGGTAKSAVTLWFTANGNNYRLVRSVESQYINGDTLSCDEPQATLHRIEDNGNYTELPERNELPSILRDLPRTAREFYLFDGEQVDRFTSESATRRIRLAIEKIVGMDVITNALEELRSTQNDIRRDLRRANTDEVFQQAVEVLENTESEIATLKDTIESDQSEVLDLDHIISRLESHLRNTPDTQDLQRRRDEIAVQQRENEDERKRALERVQQVLTQTYSCLALPALNEFAKDLRGLQDAGTLSGGIHAGFLKQLLTEELCVCGRPLGHDLEAHNHLQQLLAELEAQSPLDNSLLELRFAIPNYIDQIEELPTQLKEGICDYGVLWEQRARLRDQVEHVSEQLKAYGPSDHKRWEQERFEAVDRRRILEGDLAVAMHRLGELEQIRNNQEAEVRRLSSQTDQARDLDKQLQWVIAAIEVLGALDKEFAAIARMEATHRTVELWRRLLPNVEQYQVEITDDFELKTTSITGESGMAQLSMGQRQCLGLAFITAIAQVAGTKPPIVIDMPFGNLDGTVATELASKLPILADQLILFLLPQTEWNEATRRALEPRINRVVYLVQDQQQASSYQIEGEA